MKILLIYFSGTGNTERITELYESALTEREHEVTVLSLPCGAEISDAEYIRGFDMIGIGYPIHAFNAPEIVLKAVKRLPKLDKKHGETKRTFIYKTSGEPVRMSDVSSLKLRKILKRRGYTTNGEYQYVMPYNIIFRHSDGAAYKMWQTVKALVPVDVDELLLGTPSNPKKMAFGGFLAWVLRVEHAGAKLIGRFYKTTKDCTECGLCAKTCPANNIKKNKKGKLVFGGNCMICMRCVFNCPKNAIKPGLLNGWKVNGKYSFDPPSGEQKPDKHDNYCKKAYDRYYANAELKINKDKE